MNINYIILAHKNPAKLKRLIEKLNSSDCFFYIHVDKDVDISSFDRENIVSDKVYFVRSEKRQSSYWGDIGAVIATLDILNQIIADNRKGYCILLSGQDYPIKDNLYIKSFLKNNYGKEFINHFSIPANRWPNRGVDRLKNYKIDFSKAKGDLLLFPSVFQSDFYTQENFRNLKKLLKFSKFGIFFKLLFRRKSPSYLKPYGGSQWWAIMFETAKKIIEFSNTHPDYLVYHKYTLLPDEIFFHSIILDIHKHTTDRICETITYVNWERQNVILPVTFTTEDFSELKELPAEVLFVRKFDIEVDEKILDRIDEEFL